MICYAFPLAHEAALLLKRCTEKESFSIDGAHCTLANFGKRRVLVALIGMGEAQAGDNTETLFEYFRLKAVVLAGYGGALVPPLKVGQVVISNNFTSETVLGFLRMLSGFDFGSFCTIDEEMCIRDSAYPLSRSTFYYTNGVPAGEAKAFLDFTISHAGQKIVQEVGFAPLKS